MYRIDLKEYKNNLIYFNYFDYLLKNELISKDDKLEELNISPSSYRRSRKSETKISHQILKKLASYYDVKLLSNDEIDSLEKLFNNIYLDLYYKINENTDLYLKELEKMIAKKVILTPIIKIFKIFLKANQYVNPKDVIEGLRSEFNLVKEYKNFFSKNLEEIFIICSILFEYKYENIKFQINYKSALTYYLFSSKFNLTKNFISSLYCAEKAKEILIKENNFKRLCSLNMIILSDLNSIKNYNDAQELAATQLMLLKSFNYSGDEVNGTYTNYFISLLGMRKYSQIIEELISPKNTTDFIIKLIAENKLNKDIELTYNEALESSPKSQHVIESVYGIINENNFKKYQAEIKNTNLRYSLIEILEEVY